MRDIIHWKRRKKTIVRLSTYTDAFGHSTQLQINVWKLWTTVTWQR